ncbi:hypothetical protein D3C84_1029110 [compost metagenome]
MLRRHHNRTIPVIARQHNQIVIQMQSFSRNGEISIAFGNRFGDLRRRSLMHMQRNARVAFDKAYYHPRQCVASLCVGGGDIQRPFVRPGVFPRNRFDRIYFRKHFPGNADDLLTGRCDLCEVFTAAGKNLNT